MKTFFILTFILISQTPEVKSFEIIAHRGASGYLPEHTKEAYTLAHGMNVDYIEPDLVLTRDNEVVLVHDIHLDAITNVAQIYPRRKRDDGHYYVIDFDLKEIKSLKVMERKKNRFPQEKSNFQIVSFKEFIELIGRPQSNQKEKYWNYSRN
jgi:glycerophosphoryl diester phosphodiesterase